MLRSTLRSTLLVLLLLTSLFPSWALSPQQGAQGLGSPAQVGSAQKFRGSNYDGVEMFDVDSDAAVEDNTDRFWPGTSAVETKQPTDSTAVETDSMLAHAKGGSSSGRNGGVSRIVTSAVETEQPMGPASGLSGRNARPFAQLGS